VSEPLFAGFKYDHANAAAIAGALAPVLTQAADFGASPQDRMVALGIAAAQLILAAGWHRVPELVTQSWAALVVEEVRRASRPPG